MIGSDVLVAHMAVTSALASKFGLAGSSGT